MNCTGKKTGYSCNFCSREYREKFNYDRHHVYCEFINKSLREQNDEVDVIETQDTLPSSKQMYRWMQEMAVRIDKLEKDNAKLKQLQMKKQKVNVVDWLNNSTQIKQPDITFTDWITTFIFPQIPNYLDTVYHIDLLSGINALLKNAVMNELIEKLPIRAFHGKTQIFYAYSKTDTKWDILSTNDFNKQLSRISHQFVVEFGRNWYLVNKDKIETDENYNKMYINYYQQILGGNKMNDETRFNRIRTAFHSIIKQNTTNIVEYDIVIT